MRTSEYEKGLYLDGTEESGFQKTGKKVMNDKEHEDGALTKVSALVTAGSFPKRYNYVARKNQQR
jgi:hypothetical protein